MFYWTKYCAALLLFIAIVGCKHVTEHQLNKNIQTIDTFIVSDNSYFNNIARDSTFRDTSVFINGHLIYKEIKHNDFGTDDNPLLMLE